ncbi:MAG: carboxypeptidase-like regulatory domain-containing protein, partial [Pyrinomonadaceae bacterium]
MLSLKRAFAGSAFLLLLCTCIFAQSQATTGLIQGTVVDPNGAVLAGASITVRNTETGFERTVTSNSDGLFSAPLLPLGRYRITTTASGFANSVLD